VGPEIARALYDRGIIDSQRIMEVKYGLDNRSDSMRKGGRVARITPETFIHLLEQEDNQEILEACLNELAAPANNQLMRADYWLRGIERFASRLETTPPAQMDAARERVRDIVIKAERALARRYATERIKQVFIQKKDQLKKEIAERISHALNRVDEENPLDQTVAQKVAAAAQEFNVEPLSAVGD
jgi:GGDEF domain-containing protein